MIDRNNRTFNPFIGSILMFLLGILLFIADASEFMSVNWVNAFGFMWIVNIGTFGVWWYNEK